MLVKLIHLTGILTIASLILSPIIANPVEYPAGLDPRSCPNYPDCSTPSAASPEPQYAAAQYRSIPQYQAVQPLASASQYQAASPQYQAASPQYSAAQSPVQYSAIPATQQYQQLASQYQVAPQYQAAPQYQSAASPTAAQPSYAPALQQALDRGEYIGDGDYHGEGLSESQAFELEGVPQYAQPTASARYTQYQSAAAPQYQQSVAAAVYPRSQTINRGPQLFSPGPTAAVSQYTAATTYGGANGGPSAYSTAASPSAVPQQFPAGLDPRACPNYPFCHS